MPGLTSKRRPSYLMIGASNHTDKERASDDYYATDPAAVDMLLSSGVELSHEIWEPACGQGHLSERLKQYGYRVYSTDLIDRGYGDDHYDFLTADRKWHGDIVTNPPYKYALQFVEHALDVIDEGSRAVMFMRLLFLESKARFRFFQSLQLEKVLVCSDRMQCAKNGDFEAYHAGGAVAYAWFVFRKGYGRWPEVRWLLR